MSKISERIAQEMSEDQLRAEYEEATDRVAARYPGRRPEWPCRENGHGDCAFVEDGRCFGEMIDEEIGRMRSAQ